MNPSEYHITIIGGGIIGLTTAMQILQKSPRLKLLLLEKENRIARHQTGHNSGVIHSGIYYKPGSAKAKTCVAGRKALLEFCDREGIRYELCGKVIVAASQEELPGLEELFQRGLANGVEGLERIGPQRLKEIEPCAVGLQAIYCPATGIVDFSQVAHACARIIENLGGTIVTSAEVKNIIRKNGEMLLKSTSGDFRTRWLINCGGLYCDRLAELTDGQPPNNGNLRIIPFRGEYYNLIPEKRYLVKGLIYPVSDPAFPFLGPHFTQTIHGEVEAGPNAVLALSREGYQKMDIRPRDLWEILSYKGFWKMTWAHWKTGLMEIHRSFSKKAFVKALQQLIPEIKSEDLVPGSSGVRAQALSSTGDLMDDFEILESPQAIHVLNAPSPGATASLAIGKRIAEMAERRFLLASSA